MISSRLPRSVPARLGLVLAAAGVLALSACASTTDQASAPVASAAPNAQQGVAAGGGTSGTIAAISGTTLQVQDSSSQTAVSYDSSTTITQSVAAALSDVTNGVCITAISGGAGMPGGTSTATPTPAATDSSGTSTTAATRVTITAAESGACTTGFGQGAGGGAAMGGTPPTDAPAGVMPSGAPAAGAAGGFGGFTGGLVTAVSGSTITVQTTASDGTISSSEVTVDSSTSYTKTETADSTALVVGKCVTARGEADSSGAVAATSLTVSTAGDSGCSTGAGPGGFGGQRPGSGSASGTTTSGS
ncbi:DUF5666 domain-containing protein [Herbiconiux sp. 11R-BC]|uniref:DUF5666 domain-containing protein n=1 Tax=Herbiconiux sp. 11R-BC TaxID=3111637 RepID=UPI003BFFE76F